MYHNISGHINLKAIGLRQSVVRGGVLLSLRHIPRQRHLEAFLGLKERVGQRDGIHPPKLGILSELRVNVEEHGHVHLKHRSTH